MTPERKKALIIAGIIGGVILIGYMIVKGRSGATTAGGVNSSASPAVPSSGNDSGQSTDTSAADLLGALAGENQQLLRSLLDSTTGLVSLAGGSVGSPSSPTGSTSVSEPSAGFATSAPDILTADTLSSPSYVGPSGATVTPVTYASLGVTPSAITESMVAPPLPQPQVTETSPDVSAASSSLQSGVTEGLTGPSPDGYPVMPYQAPSPSASLPYDSPVVQSYEQATGGSPSFPVEQQGYAETNPIDTHEQGVVGGQTQQIGGNLAA